MNLVKWLGGGLVLGPRVGRKTKNPQLYSGGCLFLKHKVAFWE